MMMLSATRVGALSHGREPLGFATGDANLHRYVGNSPTNYNDPSGLDRISMTTDGAGNTILWYVPEKWIWRGDSQRKFIGVLKSINNEDFVFRDGRYVPLAKVKHEVEDAFYTTSDWTKWFKDNLVDLSSPTGKNLSIETGAWASNHNDFATGTQQMKDMAWTAVEWNAGAAFNVTSIQSIEAFVTARRATYVGDCKTAGVAATMGRVPGTPITKAELGALAKSIANRTVEFPGFGKRQVEIITDPAFVADKLPKNAGAGFWIDGKTGRVAILLRENATRYEVMHEWLHFMHFGRDVDRYRRMPDLLKEQFIFSRIRKYYWDTLSAVEKQNAIENIVKRFPGQSIDDWPKWADQWKH